MKAVAALGVVIAVLGGGCERDQVDVGGPTRIGQPGRREVRARRDLEGWMNPVPAHGLVTVRGGLGPTGPVEMRVTVDLDARTLTASAPNQPAVTRTLPDDTARRLWKQAELAWKAPAPAAEAASDYREIVVAADGDELMILSVNGPMKESPASYLVWELREAAGW